MTRFQQLARCFLQRQAQPPSSVHLRGYSSCNRKWFSTSAKLKSNSNNSSSTKPLLVHFYNPSTAATPSSNPRYYASSMTELLNEYARRESSTINLKQMLAVGSRPTPAALLKSSVYLYRELPILLAKKVKELDSLPYGLGLTDGVKRVRQMYYDSFRDILSMLEPKTAEDETNFTNLLKKIYERHRLVIAEIALGILQLKREIGGGGDDFMSSCPFLVEFLDRFYSTRIGIRLLISHHIAFHEHRPGTIGVVDLNLSPAAIIREAIADARNVCERNYLEIPDIRVTVEGGDRPFAFVPSHLHHIVFELLKNSIRAVVEYRGARAVANYPIHCVLSTSADNREFCLKISDCGGGIPRKDLPRIWSYLYTTTPDHPTEEMIEQLRNSADFAPTAPMSGFGFGLPLSRLYARFFGGDLQLMTMPGHGTDVYLYLNRIGDVDFFAAE